MRQVLRSLLVGGFTLYSCGFCSWVVLFNFLTAWTATQAPPWAGAAILNWQAGASPGTYLETGLPAPGRAVAPGDRFQSNGLLFRGANVEWWEYSGPTGFVCGAVLAGGVVTSRFGATRIDDAGGVRTHGGIDYGLNGNPVGAPVHTPLSGKVVFLGVPAVAEYGNLVVIENQGVQVYLAHNEGFNVALGQVVAAGEVVAFMGSTGASSAAHAHLEFRGREQHGAGGFREAALDPFSVYLPGQTADCDWYAEQPYE